MPNLRTTLDTTYGADQASKNIINAIESLAKIKMEKVNFQKSLLLDQLNRERNLSDKKKTLEMQTQQGLEQKQGELELGREYENKRQQDMLNMLGFGQAEQTIQPKPQETPTEENKLPAMSLVGGGVGDVSGNQIEATQPMQNDVVLNNKVYPKADELYKSLINSGKKPNLPALIQYKRIYDTFLKGQGSENGKNFMDDILNNIYEIKKSSEDMSDIPAEEQVKARSLARKLYGVRGAEKGLPAIIQNIRSGKTVDEIEDMIRFSGQSNEFTGTVRDAAQEILINANPNVSERAMDYIDDELSKGNITGVKSKLKRLSRANAGVDEQRAVVGKERTIKLLDEIQDDLNNLEASGIDTNIFTGTAEQIASKIGTVREPRLRKLATKIAASVQNYRRSMTGVQFGLPENEEYKIMFPTIKRTANFNSANISGLKEVLQGDLDNFYSLYMGEQNYNILFGDIGVSSNNTTSKGNFSYLWE